MDGTDPGTILPGTGIPGTALITDGVAGMTRGIIPGTVPGTILPGTARGTILPGTGILGTALITAAGMIPGIMAITATAAMAITTIMWAAASTEARALPGRRATA